MLLYEPAHCGTQICKFGFHYQIGLAVRPDILIGALIVDLAMLLLGEFALRHPTEVAARAAKDITHGRYQGLFWLDGIGIGHAIPLGLLAVGGDLALGVAALCTTVGLFAYEYAFVMAPQRVPNS